MRVFYFFINISMPQILHTQSQPNPIKEDFRSLIAEIKKLPDFSGTIQELPKELQVIVRNLEKQGVDFSQLDTKTPLLESLISSFNEAYPQEKIQKPIDATKSVVQTTIDATPEVQKRLSAWQKLASELNIDTNSVQINNNGIKIN
jgi:hypothetical protein